MKFSVLISVYSKESAVHFHQALESIVNQTRMPDEIVLVKDGLLSPELEAVIQYFQNRFPELFKIVSLKENQGLGMALRIGVLYCSHDIVLRMDSDDISIPERFEKQVRIFEENSHLALLGTYIGEFSEDVHKIHTIRKVPLTYGEIQRWAKYRNPFNHVTVGFRKNAVLAAGNYRPVLFHEDYDLWIRMLKNGFYMMNLPEVLVFVRTGLEQFKRRGGIGYIRHMFQFQKKLREEGFITDLEFIRNIVIRGSIQIMPNSLRKSMYQTFLREDGQKGIKKKITEA